MSPASTAGITPDPSAGTALERPEAIAIAKRFVALLDGTYTDLKVAGSLRRRLAVVRDIEIVAVPKVVTVQGGLFGDELSTTDLLNLPMIALPEPSTADLLDLRMMALLEAGTVTKRLDRNGAPRWGPTLKYLTFEGARIDLFTPCAERVGWILMLRTGPAAFSRQVVLPSRDDHGRALQTRDGRPGLLPPSVRPRDGWLTMRTSGERIPTPTERDAFAALTLAYREPWERT